ncbi:MAG: hypothetical protein PHD40_07655 [Syntrophomonadaceae bacterium]|nr:hypothetical protein [Syntrophomonadaceae bacterium]
MPAKQSASGKKYSWLNTFSIALIIGLVLGLYSGYTALAPMEDDYEMVYFTGMSEGESDAKTEGNNNFIPLYEKQQLDINTIQNALNKFDRL